jgi:hypothetical protein
MEIGRLEGRGDYKLRSGKLVDGNISMHPTSEARIPIQNSVVAGRKQATNKELGKAATRKPSSVL